MKNDKLKMLLNKVVEFNRNGKTPINVKGFLYKKPQKSEKYYIKVVEVIQGKHIKINDLIDLVSGDEKYITIAEKPKLMRVSLKSWHYRLIKFILGNNAPTPQNMQNGCPYFWLLILSMILSPFKLLGKLFISTLDGITNILVWLLEGVTNDWVDSISDEQAYEIFTNNLSSNSYANMPLTVKKYFKNKYGDNLTGIEFYKHYIKEKYGINFEKQNADFNKTNADIEKRWNLWRMNLRKKRDEFDNLMFKKRQKELEISRIKEKEYKEKWDARMKPLTNFIDEIIAFFDTNNWKIMIRRTKQFVGFIITTLLLITSFFLVNFIVYGLTILIDLCIENWEFLVVFGVGTVLMGISYMLYFILTTWIQSLIIKYKKGKKIWYVEPMIYLFYYPLKYLVTAICYTFLYVIYYPMKFLIYNILYLFMWKNLIKLGRWIGRGFMNSIGIFGEYFDASYTDYCPGIEWVDTEDVNETK